MASHRIKIRLGDAEFEAEGTETSVQSQYDQFLEAISKRNQAAPQAKSPLQQNDAEKLPSPGTVDEAMLGRIFELRGDGIIALRVLPKGDDREADAFLLLLYGYRRLKGEEDILGTILLRSAQHSGIGTYRPGHVLAAYDRFLIRGGQKKGSTYSLNNQGVIKAEEIASKIFE